MNAVMDVIRTAEPATGTLTTPGLPLSLEARLAAVDAAMTVRLETALLALAVDSVFTEQPVDLVDIVRAPVAVPTVTEPEYTTPIAALLQRSQRRLAVDGWCTGALRDPAGRRCLVGAIRAEAPHRGIEASAAAVVLDAIQQRFAGIETVPQFNDHVATPESALQILGEAADLAHTRRI